MQTHAPPITPDPVPPPAASYYCDCPRPVAEQRAVRHGAARTYCARCDRELPLTIGRP
jgi:predicted SprT family Zn-dependent metalloprotease